MVAPIVILMMILDDEPQWLVPNINPKNSDVIKPKNTILNKYGSIGVSL